jgi:glyoxylate reductase
MVKRLLLVVFTSPLPGDALSLLEGKARAKVYRHPKPFTEELLVRRLKGASGAVTLLGDRITAGVLESCPRLKVVSNYAVGVDNVDLEAARRLGVAVTNTPDVLTEATADLAWTLLLGVARRVIEGDRMMRRGAFRGWVPDLLLGMDLRGKHLGVVGMGRIGQAVARRAPAFGLRVLYADDARLPESVESSLGARRVSLDELLRQSDIVSLHCPLTPRTRHLLDREKLFAMKRGAILVNTARGPVIDEEALVEALSQGHLMGAGMDVYEREPALAPGLAKLENALLLPHVGSAARETREAMARLAVRNCLAVLESREPECRIV